MGQTYSWYETATHSCWNTRFCQVWMIGLGLSSGRLSVAHIRKVGPESSSWSSDRKSRAWTILVKRLAPLAHSTNAQTLGECCHVCVATNPGRFNVTKPQTHEKSNDIYCWCIVSFFDKQIICFPFSLKKLYNIKKHTKNIFITYTRHLRP